MIRTFSNLLLVAPKVLKRTIICPGWYSGDQKDIKVFRKAITDNDIPKMQEYYNKVHPYTQYLGLMDAIRTHNYAITEILLDKIKDTSGPLDLLCDEDIGRYELGDTPLKTCLKYHKLYVGSSPNPYQKIFDLLKK